MEKLTSCGVDPGFQPLVSALAEHGDFVSYRSVGYFDPPRFDRTLEIEK